MYYIYNGSFIECDDVITILKYPIMGDRDYIQIKRMIKRKIPFVITKEGVKKYSKLFSCCI